jgi:hypothetical protein
MHLVLAAKVWHYWLAIPLLAAPVLACVALLVGYLVKVTGAKYPKK